MTIRQTPWIGALPRRPHRGCDRHRRARRRDHRLERQGRGHRRREAHAATAERARHGDDAHRDVRGGQRHRAAYSPYGSISPQTVARQRRPRRRPPRMPCWSRCIRTRRPISTPTEGLAGCRSPRGGEEQGHRARQEAAAEMMALRAKDGTDVPESYRPHTPAGAYVPTVIPVCSTYGRSRRG